MNQTILYIKYVNRSFIVKDEEILKKHFQVKIFLIKNSTKLTYFFSTFKMILFLFRNIKSCSVVFTRFADYHTLPMVLIAKIFNKKSIIVSGGFDTYYIKSINYGAYKNYIRSWCVKYSFMNTDYILPVSSNLIYGQNKFIDGSTITNGIKYFVPKTKAIIKTIHNGYLSNFWLKPKDLQKEKIALMVGNIDNWKVFERKNIKNFINAAKLLPSFNFIIVGFSKTIYDKLKNSLPGNLITYPILDKNRLLEIYSKSKVFCMLSLAEGMSNVLCEAMLCECIPVVSQIGITSEIVGETGFIVKKNDLNEIVKKIEQAFKADETLGKLARERIKKDYSFERRENELLKVLNNL